MNSALEYVNAGNTRDVGDPRRVSVGDEARGLRDISRIDDPDLSICGIGLGEIVKPPQ